ncbi:hypothetical protein ACFSYD_07355 [Paracoccus aerius]
MSQPYCGPGAAPDEIWAAWNPDPVVLAALALLAAALWRRGSGKAGLIAVLALAVAFVSPLCALTVSLFSARALHHILLAGSRRPPWPWPGPLPAG